MKLLLFMGWTFKQVLDHIESCSGRDGKTNQALVLRQEDFHSMEVHGPVKEELHKDPFWTPVC